MRTALEQRGAHQNPSPLQVAILFESLWLHEMQKIPFLPCWNQNNSNNVTSLSVISLKSTLKDPFYLKLERNIKCLLSKRVWTQRRLSISASHYCHWMLNDLLCLLWRNLVKASDDLSFANIPDERSVTRRGSCDAVQVSFKQKTDEF